MRHRTGGSGIIGLQQLFLLRTPKRFNSSNHKNGSNNNHNDTNSGKSTSKNNSQKDNRSKGAQDEAGTQLADIVSFCKRRGFVFPSSSLYGGLTGSFDYGPLGAQLKKNIRDKWWQDFVERRQDCLGIETSIILHPRVWEQSGHVANFVDPLVECTNCKKRFRVDQLYEKQDEAAQQFFSSLQRYSQQEQEELITQFVREHPPPASSRCSCCTANSRNWSSAKMFNLLFRTHYGPTTTYRSHSAVVVQQQVSQPLEQQPLSQSQQPQSQQLEQQQPLLQAQELKQQSQPLSQQPLSQQSQAQSLEQQQQPVSQVPQDYYLRPETAQGIFINYLNLVSTNRKKIPFGVGQVGRSFRNEISPRDFLFRMREFEQMELEYFCEPKDANVYFEHWVQFCIDWLTRYGLKPQHFKKYDYARDECAHYALQTTDILYKFPFGWSELWGIANRGDYDLRAHRIPPQPSSHTPSTTVPHGSHTQLPYVIEPAVGLDRLFLAFLLDAYRVETVTGTGVETTGTRAADSAGIGTVTGTGVGTVDSTTGDQTAIPGTQGSNKEIKTSQRTVLSLHRELAPFQFAVFPLVKREPLISLSAQLFNMLKETTQCFRGMNIDYDASGSIGQMYRRHDEIGTPYCITVDYDTHREVSNNAHNTATGALLHATVTIRDRDSMRQWRVKVSQLLQDAHNYIFRNDQPFAA